MIKSIKPALTAVALSVAMLSQGAVAAEEQFFPIPGYRVGPYGANGQSFYGGFLPASLRQPEGKGRQWRHPDSRRVRNRVQQRQGRRVLRAPEEQGGQVGRPDPHHVHRHFLCPDRQVGPGQAAAGHDGLWPYRRGGRLGLPLRLPAGHHLPDAGLRHRQVHQGKEWRQPGRQEDRVSLSRFRLQRSHHRDGNRGFAEQVPAGADSGRSPGQRTGRPVAEDSPRRSRISSFSTGLGRDEPDRLKAAQKVGFPRDRMIGSWWTGSEEDVVPAGDASRVSQATWNVAGKDVPVIADIEKVVYGAGEDGYLGQVQDRHRLPAARHFRRRAVGRSHPQGPGKVWQGQGADRRGRPAGRWRTWISPTPA